MATYRTGQRTRLSEYLSINSAKSLSLDEICRALLPDGKGKSTIYRLRDEKKHPPIDHIPAWYRWERDEVKKEIADGTYRLDCHVNILVLRDFKAVYDIGGGRLTHDVEGFRLISDDGELDYSQKPTASYSLYSDYYWYEIGDMICIGNNEMLYYCFPDDANIPVAKVRLAAEELYKRAVANRRQKPSSVC